MNDDSSLRIGEVARLAGVRTSLLRYYEEIGLLPEPARVSGQRRYDRSVLRRLSVIDIGQRAGLSLQEIAEVLDAGSDPFSGRLHDIAARRLPELDALIDRATAMRAWLAAATDCGCEAIDECELFSAATAPPPVVRPRALQAR